MPTNTVSTRHLLGQRQLGVVLLCCAGIALRFAPLIWIDPNLPADLGGLFLEFATQIEAAGFGLPHNIPYYSSAGLPFAYPPLAFYVEALLLHLLPVSDIAIGNILPMVIGAASIPLFYWLTCEWELSYSERVSALLIYALLPAAFQEQVGSAGLAESLGSGSVILLAISLSGLARGLGVGRSLVAGLAWALCVLASPGSAYASVLLVFVLACNALGKAGESGSRLTILGSLLIAGASAVLISAPYWFTTAMRHGIGIFTASFGAQHGDPLSFVLSALLTILRFDVALGPLGLVANALILGGLIQEFRHRRSLNALWFLVFAVIPREGRWLSAAPAAILGGIGLVALLELLNRSRGSVGRLGGFVVVSVSLLLNAGGVLMTKATDYDRELWTNVVDASTNIREHTPQDATFVVLADSTVREWVPYLSKREVLNVEWGQEWEPSDFVVIDGVNAALDSCSDLACVCEQTAPLSSDVDYYLVQHSSSPAWSPGWECTRDPSCAWANEQFSLTDAGYCNN